MLQTSEQSNMTSCDTQDCSAAYGIPATSFCLCIAAQLGAIHCKLRQAPSDRLLFSHQHAPQAADGPTWETTTCSNSIMLSDGLSRLIQEAHHNPIAAPAFDSCQHPTAGSKPPIDVRLLHFGSQRLAYGMLVTQSAHVCN
jgi:hypothetical protein